MPEPRLRLRPGIRVSERSDRTLQVGLHPGRRVVLRDEPAVRAALTLLGHGVEPGRVDLDQHDLLGRLTTAGLVTDADDEVTRARLRAGAAVEVKATGPVRASLA